MLKSDGGVAGWSQCSRTPHDETVLGGRAQWIDAAEPAEKRVSARSGRVGENRGLFDHPAG